MKKALLIFFVAISFTTSYAASPTITSFSPTSGAVGTLVTITGTNLTSPTAFSIGGKAAIVISNTGTKLVGMVMPGAVSGAVTVTTAGGSASGGSNFGILATSFPSVQQGAKLVGAGNIGSGSGDTNYSVSLSADGNTAVIGTDYDNAELGAAYIFIRTGTTWTQQAKLFGTGYTGSGVDEGYSVAISADGNTVIIGADNDNAGVGAAWIFARSGTSWTQQAKLTGTGATGNEPQEGNSVAISGDGNTAVVGGPIDNAGEGAVWVYTRNGSTWTQQGNKLAGTGAVGKSLQGSAVAISADGKTIASGGYFDNAAQGAIWIFTKSGSAWTQQGNKLVGTGAVGSMIYQGVAGIGLSADGNTMIEGGEGDNTLIGAAWVFTRSGTTWAQQGGKLVGSESVGQAAQGYGVSISADGNTAAIGGPGDNALSGAVWIFTRSGTTWTQKGSKLVGTGNVGSATQGYGVCLSGDGKTMISGGYQDNAFRGAAWIFVAGTATQQSQTITFAQPAPVTYGVADVGPGATASSGLTVSYTSSNTAVATIVSGNIHIISPGTTTITASQAGDANYTAATPVSHTLTVNKAPLTISANSQSKWYTQANPTLTVTYAGFVNGDTNTTGLTTQPTVTTTATSTSSPGNYPVTASGAVSSKYTFTYVAGTLTVKAIPTVNYGTPDFNPDPSVTGVTYTTNNPAVATVVNNKIHLVAAGVVVITGSKGGSHGGAPLQVKPARLTITANNQTKVAGTANPALTVSYSGFFNGDTQSGFTTQPTVSTTATTSSPAGNYPITVSGGSSNKYTFNYVAGTLKVTAATLSIPNQEDLAVNDNILIYPNPASATTNVKYKLPAQSDVVINIYSKGGKLLSTYKTSGQTSGLHTNALETSKLNLGFYIITLSANGYNKIGKLIIQ